ncbi:hypothetical protein BH23ACT9_BH23ACT9_19950 [soil metagenome]
MIRSMRSSDPRVNPRSQNLRLLECVEAGDRLLVAQAQATGVPLLTADAALADYGIDVLLL